LPRLSHPSAELALETRVAPHIRCTSTASQRAVELPRTLAFRLLPVMDLRCAPNLASFVGAGVEFPGSPESSPSSAASRSVPRVAPDSRSSGFAEVESPGCPEASFSSARRLVAVRVSPLPAPSGDASGESPGRPESSLLWLRLLCGVSSRLESAPFSAPGDLALGRPWPLIFRRIRITISRVAPFPRFDVRASDGVPGCPVASHPPGLPHRVFAFPRILLQRPVR